MIRAAIVGGSGYVGGEVLRLLLFHPEVDVAQVTSASQAGRFVHTAHPNLRGVSKLQFTHPETLPCCDILFLCEAHGRAAGKIEEYAAIAERIVDCSADFRLDDPAAYKKWYGEDHPSPDWLEKFVYGLPEACREALAGTRYVSGVGCNATVTNLALMPLAKEGLLERVVADVKVGSAEGGGRSSDASHHPERSGAVRSFMPVGHRHQAEVRQVLGEDFGLSFSVTAVELVRGALVTAHCFLKEPLKEKELWKLYRKAMEGEPFLRMVKQKTGIHRYPEPKLLSGSNYCDVGFAVDEDRSTARVVVIAAIDNLVKGAAGSAVQSMNIMMGWDERAGLEFPGLHPI